MICIIENLNRSWLQCVRRWLNCDSIYD